MSRTLPLALAFLASGCAQPIQSASVPQAFAAGRWAGDQVELELFPDGHGLVTLPCAKVEFAGPLKRDIGGHFLAAGLLTSSAGPDTRPPRSAVPANVSGRLDPGGILWLDVALRDSYPVRSVRLRRGSSSNLLRCL